MRDRKQELLEELDLLLGDEEMGEQGELEDNVELDQYLMGDFADTEQASQKQERDMSSEQEIIESPLESESLTETNIEEEVKDSLIHVEDRDVSYDEDKSVRLGGQDEIIDLDKEYDMEEPGEKSGKFRKKFIKGGKRGYGKITEDSFFDQPKNIWIYCVVIGAIAFVMFFILIRGMLLKQGDEKETKVRQTEQSQEPKQTEPVTENNNPLTMNKYDDVKVLVQTYYKAVTDCDMATLSKVVDDTSDLSEEVLIKQKEYIESYDKIETYVKNGIKENTYVVWVYYETKLLNIDTSAPGSSVLYVERNEKDNTVHICNSSKDKKIVEYINKLMKDQDVIDFNKNVNVKLERACAQDKDLEQFVSKINGENESTTQQ